MRFDCSGKLGGQEYVLLIGWVVDVDKHLSKSIRQVQGIVDMRATILMVQIIAGVTEAIPAVCN